VKGWGKSPPAPWRHGGSPNPVRCKTNRLRYEVTRPGAGSLPRGMVTLDRIRLTGLLQESPAQAGFSHLRAAFVHHRCITLGFLKDLVFFYEECGQSGGIDLVGCDDMRVDVEAHRWPCVTCSICEFTSGDALKVPQRDSTVAKSVWGAVGQALGYADVMHGAPKPVSGNVGKEEPLCRERGRDDLHQPRGHWYPPRSSLSASAFAVDRLDKEAERPNVDIRAFE
jgi:hypothetical protein